MTSVPFPTAEEVAELLVRKWVRKSSNGRESIEEVPVKRAELESLCAATSFALKAEAFLREHGEHARAGIQRGISDVPWDAPQWEAADAAILDLLRSLPARDEAGRDV
jgi:hypothetical protein